MNNSESWSDSQKKVVFKPDEKFGFDPDEKSGFDGQEKNSDSIVKIKPEFDPKRKILILQKKTFGF